MEPNNLVVLADIRKKKRLQPNKEGTLPAGRGSGKETVDTVYHLASRLRKLEIRLEDYAHKLVVAIDSLDAAVEKLTQRQNTLTTILKELVENRD